MEDGLPSPNCLEGSVVLTADLPAVVGVVGDGGGEKQRRNGGRSGRKKMFERKMSFPAPDCFKGTGDTYRLPAVEEGCGKKRMGERERGRERGNGRRRGVIRSPATRSSRPRGRQAVRPSTITKGVTIKVAGLRTQERPDTEAEGRGSPVNLGVPRSRGCEATKIVRPSGHRQPRKGDLRSQDCEAQGQTDRGNGSKKISQ